MANVVSKLRQALGAGARVSKYKIIMALPQAVGGGGDTSDMINTLCNSSSFPGLSQTPIEVHTQGRKVVIPGSTEYETTWTVTFYQTEGHELRKEFLRWMQAMDDFHNNKHQGDMTQFMVEAKVIQLDHDEQETASYLFKDLFPSQVSQVQVTDSSTNEIQNFDVTFSLTSWKLDK